MFTKDWIVVLSKRETGNTLSSKLGSFNFKFQSALDRNAIITIIGHLASLITALLASYLIVYFGHLKATLIFVAFNLGSWIVECYLLTKLYNEVVELHSRHNNDSTLNDSKRF